MTLKEAEQINVGDKVIVKDYPGEHEVLVIQDIHPGQVIGYWLDNGDLINHKQVERVSEIGRTRIAVPCKIGDTVYSITRDFISEYVVESIRIYEHSIQFYWKCTKGIYHNVVGFANFDIGKTVFLTEQEAQAALEKMKGEGAHSE